MLKLTLIACGNKMPLWVNEACKEFSKRLNEYVNLKIVEIPLATRHKSSDMVRLMEKESALILQAIPAGSYVISLEIFGKAYLSEELAEHLQKLQQTTSHLCFIIGGPEGLTEQILRKAHENWSLSKLTFPHPIVRVLVLESLYRAFSIIHNHPYHK